MIHIFNFNNFHINEIIITTSTSPKRLDKVDSIIDNILNKQTMKPTKFYLNVPYVFKRTGETYPEEILDNLRKKYSKLQINRCEDIGPVTKVSETLKLNNNENDVIIIIDDDTYYPPNFIEELINNLIKESKKNNNVVIANSIFSKNINTTDVDIVEGFKGICFKRYIFSDDFFDYIKKSNNYIHCYKSDDYVMSRYLTEKNVKFIKPNNNFRTLQYDYGFEDDALHKQDNIEHKQRYNMCMRYLDDNI